jgi:16S rRNA (uracil1498-N3)-methyltransferase
MELFFTETQLITKNTARFDNFESRHILKTLRKNIGDNLDFTDGKGNIYHGSISHSSPDLIVEYKRVTKIPLSNPKINLAIGFIKQTRMDFIFEKGTELGVNNFYLFASNNTNYYSENISRWQKITRQAIKQSLRCHLPGIKCFKDFSGLLDMSNQIPFKLIAHQNAPADANSILNAWKKKETDDIIILIGPEGGFTDIELEQAHQQKFESISFGKNRLRSETAALAAIANINLFRNQIN